jgi:membrane associated rhomboid family serine protease
MRQPQNWQSARVTLVIAAMTAVAWLLVAAAGQTAWAAAAGGFTPARLHGLPAGQLAALMLVTPLTATLIHSGFVHLGFNLVIFVFCGRAIETILGARGILVLYVVGAYAAAAAQYLAGPYSTTPMVGASGAISAVIGATAILLGRNRVKVANPVLARILHALWLAAAWIVLNVLMGIVLAYPNGPVIAVGAHIGGFLAGLILAKPLLLLRWRGA